MSLHLNPIEPDDWANGPDHPEPDCPDCEGTGEVDTDVQDLTRTCERCGGSGYLPVDHYDDWAEER